MKKRTVALVFTMIISLSIVGCGKSAEPKKEEPQETQEQEEKELGTKEIDGDIVFYTELPEYGDYLLSDIEGFETVDEFHVTSTNKLPVYSIDGINVGYVKNGITVTVNEKGINSAWFHFLNPISGTDYEYLYVLSDDLITYGNVDNRYTPEEYFAKVREEIDKLEQESQESYDQFLEENPDIDLSIAGSPRKTITKDSPDGLETDGSIIGPSLLKNEDIESSIRSDAQWIFGKYEEYYIDVTKESYFGMEYQVYGKERE